MLFYIYHFRNLKSFYLGYVYQIEHTRSPFSQQLFHKLVEELYATNSQRHFFMNIDIIDKNNKTYIELTLYGNVLIDFM